MVGASFFTLYAYQSAATQHCHKRTAKKGELPAIASNSPIFLGIAKIVLLQPFAVHPLNILDCQHRPVVLIFRVLSAIALVEINL